MKRELYHVGVIIQISFNWNDFSSLCCWVSSMLIAIEVFCLNFSSRARLFHLNSNLMMLFMIYKLHSMSWGGFSVRRYFDMTFRRLFKVCDTILIILQLLIINLTLTADIKLHIRWNLSSGLNFIIIGHTARKVISLSSSPSCQI